MDHFIHFRTFFTYTYKINIILLYFIKTLFLLLIEYTLNYTLNCLRECFCLQKTASQCEKYYRHIVNDNIFKLTKKKKCNGSLILLLHSVVS